MEDRLILVIDVHGILLGTSVTLTQHMESMHTLSERRKSLAASTAGRTKESSNASSSSSVCSGGLTTTPISIMTPESTKSRSSSYLL